MKTKLLLVVVVLFFGIGAKQAHRLYANKLAEEYTISDTIYYHMECVPLDNILRLDNGQIQRLDPNEGWVCAHKEIFSSWLTTDSIADGEVLNVDEAIIAAYDYNTLDVEDEFIRALAKRGRICEALKEHQWRDYDTIAHFLTGTDTSREKCAICGKMRQRKWTEGWSEWQEFKERNKK